MHDVARPGLHHPTASHRAMCESSPSIRYCRHAVLVNGRRRASSKKTKNSWASIRQAIRSPPRPRAGALGRKRGAPRHIRIRARRRQSCFCPCTALVTELPKARATFIFGHLKFGLAVLARSSHTTDGGRAVTLANLRG